MYVTAVFGLMTAHVRGENESIVIPVESLYKFDCMNWLERLAALRYNSLLVAWNRYADTLCCN